MTTPEMIRCKKCDYLTINEDGKYICTACEKDIHEIKNEECEIEQDY